MSTFVAAPPGSAPPSRPPRPLTVAQVAYRLGSDVWTVRRLIKRGRFPNAFRVDVNGPWRIPPADVEEHIARMRVSPVHRVHSIPQNQEPATRRALAGAKE